MKKVYCFDPYWCYPFLHSITPSFLLLIISINQIICLLHLFMANQKKNFPIFSSQLLEAMESNLYGAENVITEKILFCFEKK